MNADHLPDENVASPMSEFYERIAFSGQPSAISDQPSANSDQRSAFSENRMDKER
jgi:hypothetical protein